MALKIGKKYKTKANRTTTSSSTPTQVNRVRFPIAMSKEIFETLAKYRSIWGERQIVLDELDPSICRTLVSRNWVSLCDVFYPPLAALIREFYSNLVKEKNFMPHGFISLATHTTSILSWI